MEEIELIRRFLGAVRRRALLAQALRAAAATVAALLVAFLILGAWAGRVGPAPFWPTLTIAIVLVFLAAGLTWGWIAPSRRLRHERAVASLVGHQVPPLASDLLSAVELAPDSPGISPTITHAFHASVAQAVSPLDPRGLVPLRAAAKMGLLLAATAMVLGLAIWKTDLRRGLSLLVRNPTRFEGAAITGEPLIGDVRIIYTFPAYTGLAARVVEGSTGDLVALKGTKVTLEARLLRSAREARLLFGDAGEAGEGPAAVAKGKLTAALTLRDSGSYRVWLSPRLGRPVREARPHRIVVETDRPPEVEIIGPADRLELPAPRPVEVAYSARDDFGLGAVDLVYRVDEGAEHRLPLKEANGTRSAQGKTLFEVTGVTLPPGARVAYRIEARDRDDVSGTGNTGNVGKTGSSRTLYLTIQNPRENLDEQLQREREILDKLLATLGDRLEMGEPPMAPAAGAAAANGLAYLSSWVAIHDNEESHLALLGRMVDEERRSGSASKTLVNALAGIADRLGKQMREESAQLQGLRGRADQGALTAAAFGKLRSAADKHVVELESAVLLLDDLIGRQRLEDLAALGRELTGAYKRLQDLLARYNSTRDEALKRQLEREMRDLRARIEEMARKIAEVKARNEVSGEWQNMPDMKEAMEKAAKLDQMLEKGDPQSMSKALAELGSTLEQLQRMLDKNADDFGSDRFPQENKLATEMMKKLGDLEGDQRSVAGDSQGLAGEVDQEVQKRLKGEADKLLNGIKEKAEALRKKLGTSAPREAGEVARDELERSQEAAKQLKRLIPAQELAEAKKETERLSGSLKRMRRSLDDRATWRKQQSPSTEAFSAEMADAQKLAQELQDDLSKLVPRPEEAMSQQQRERSRGLGERQGSLQERGRQLADEMGKKAGGIPGADRTGEELKSIAERMGEAGGDLQRGSAKEGAGKAQEAADRLAKLRDGMGKRQMGRSQASREPVRIPGADESKAPREWRAELMEAMRERAPERFREEVRRYYEELVK